MTSTQMLRQNEQLDSNKTETQAKKPADAVVDATERQKAASRRTAWIIGAIAFGFFVASLFQGHLAHIPH